jgi:hypothetical protein
MTTLELLEQYPKTTALIKEWYLDRMLESFKDETVPEDFKEMMRAQPIDDNVIAKMIDGIPRSLFDFFDNHEIYISIKHYPEQGFSHDGPPYYNTRRESEIVAIEEAFIWLEKKL